MINVRMQTLWHKGEQLFYPLGKNPKYKNQRIEIFELWENIVEFSY